MAVLSLLTLGVRYPTPAAFPSSCTSLPSPSPLLSLLISFPCLSSLIWCHHNKTLKAGDFLKERCLFGPKVLPSMVLAPAPATAPARDITCYSERKSQREGPVSFFCTDESTPAGSFSRSFCPSVKDSHNPPSLR